MASQKQGGPVGSTLPPPCFTVKIENNGKQFRPPFVIYANFECTLEKESNPNEAQQQKPSCYAFKTVCCSDNQCNSG